GESVSAERLLDELWSTSSPAGGAKAVQVYVSRLRSVLGPGVIETRGRTYVLAAESVTTDLDRFEELASEAERLCDGGQFAPAVERLDAALALWRGDPLSDFAYEEFARIEIARLTELRLLALEEQIDAKLGTRRADALVAQLEALVLEHPARERLLGQL